jgi:ADP-heptose:LPS heptosyltransferase
MFGHDETEPHPIFPVALMRLLLLQLKRIGDLVLTTPAITCLREKFPQAQIILTLEKGSAGLLPLIDHDEAIILRRGKLDLAQWQELTLSPFDVCLDFTGNDRSALVTSVSRAGRRITWQRFARKPLRRWIYTEFVESRVQDRHTADHHTDLLQPLGIERSGVPSRLTVPSDIQTRVDELLAGHGVRGPFIVVHPGSARAEKFWRSEGWAEVIQEILRTTTCQVIVTGAGTRDEETHLQEILTACPPSCRERIVNLAGACELAELAGVLRRARVVCGVDSAPLHFADALQVPVLALFGPTNPLQWRPRDTASKILVPPGTKPIGPKYDPGAPVQNIPVAHVLQALHELLPENSAAPA